MATYLQGVTDYIPDYQPFQPDLNFYSSFLQKKQNEYDTNWKSLSNLYGQYFNAELTNTENVDVKDKMLKQIDFNLQRVAGLDLSLEQNVDQATQIFTPFYQDKPLMRDMAYTRNFNNTLAKAQALATSKDEKQQKQYWDTGIEYMMYKKEEFKNAKREDVVNFGDTEYVPQIKGVEFFTETADKLGIKADITQTDGRYFVRKKNGDQLLQPLENIFGATFANDANLQKVYQVRAYVERKRYINQNKNQFQGDVGQTERKYLNEQLATIQEYTKLKNERDKVNTQQVAKKLEVVDKKLETGQGNQFTDSYKRALEESFGIAQTVENMSTQLAGTVNANKEERSPAATEDLELLRFQVEAGTAAMLADQDIQRAAYIYSRKDMLIDVAADPYGVSAQNNAYRMQQQQYASQLKREEMALKSEYDLQKVTVQQGLKNGTYLINSKGQAELNMSLFQPVVVSGRNSSGSATDQNTSLVKENHLAFMDQTKTAGDPMIREMSNYMQRLVTSGELTESEAAKLFFGTEKGGAWSNPNDFFDNYKEKGGSYLYGLNTSKKNKLTQLYSRVLAYAQANGGDDDLSAAFLQSENHGKFNEYLTFVTGMHTVNIKNREAISKNLKSSTLLEGLKPDVKNQVIELAVSKSNGLISEEQFVKATKNLVKEHVSSINKLKTKPNYGIYDKNAFEEVRLTGIDEQDLMNITKTSKSLSESQFRKEKNNIAAGKTKGSKYYAVKDASGRINYYKNNFGKAKNIDRQVEDINSTLNVDAYVKDVYYDLSKIYREVAQNGDELISITPTMGGKANATASTKEQEWIIAPNVIGTDGFKGWSQFVTKDLGNINWYDNSKNKISLYGNNISGIDKTSDVIDHQELVAASNYIIQKLWSQTGKDKTSFRIASNQRALEQRNKGSMTVYPDYDFLKTLAKGEDKGMLTDEVIKLMTTNGITFISDKNNWSNKIFTDNQTTPLEAIVGALGEVKYEHPFGAGSYTISENKTGVSNYNIDYTLNQLLPDGTTVSRPYAFPSNSYNLEELTQEIMKSMNYLGEINKQQSRQNRANK